MTYSSSNYRPRNYGFPPRREVTQRVESAFNADSLRAMCMDSPDVIEKRYDMTRIEISSDDLRRPLTPGEDFYLFKDNDSRVLAVAHLDSVEEIPTCAVVDTAAGPLVVSTTLDDRLGAYVIADLLPALGITCDLLFTVGEETGNSTAQFFTTEMHDKASYDWVIQFDRGGTDVVLYQYEDDDTIALVEATGAVVGDGAFSDISYLDHLGVKCFNWGVGYRDYHGPRAHAWLADTFKMVAYFLAFHEDNDGTTLTHEVEVNPWASLRVGGSDAWLGSAVEDYQSSIDETVCIEAEDDEASCSGQIEVGNSTGFPLCEYHADWYE